MSFLSHGARSLGPLGKVDPLTKFVVREATPSPPGPPDVPNPNDALNASRTTTDAMRMRRGMLANIYAGAQNQQPVTGKTQLGA